MIDTKQPVEGLARDGSWWLLFNRSWSASFTLAEWNIIRLYWRERRYKWAGMQSTQTTPPQLLEHTHTVHFPLLAIIQHTLHNSNNLWLCEIDFWGALPRKHPLSSLKAALAEGTGTHSSKAPPPDQHILWFCQGHFLKRLLRWIQHDTLVMQQAASSKVMQREESSSEKHLTELFSNVV